MTKKLYLLCSIATLLSGCGALIATPYETPELQMPDSYVEGVSQSVSAQIAFPESFRDPLLTRYVADMLARNNDLAAAGFRVKAAALQADLAADQYLPDLSAQGSSADSRNLRGKQTITRSFGGQTQISYELDLWGKIGFQSDSAHWQAMASAKDKASTAISLIGSTIKLYGQIAYAREKMDLAQDSISYAERTRALVQTQYDAGYVSKIDVLAAENSLASAKASYQDDAQSWAQAQHAFAILFDRPPGTLAPLPDRLTGRLIPDISAGLPASLLSRRPDIMAAEYRLRAVLADFDATRASYLPSFSLTGSMGSSSIALTDALANPIAAFGTGIALPFLNYFDMRKNTDIAEATYQEAIVAFRQTLYTALAEVEDALSSIQKHKAQGVMLTLAEATAKESMDLSEVQYKEGYVSLQSWLDAQEKYRKALGARLDNQWNQWQDSVTLYKALGGDPR